MDIPPDIQGHINRSIGKSTTVSEMDTINIFICDNMFDPRPQRIPTADAELPQAPALTIITSEQADGLISKPRDLGFRITTRRFATLHDANIRTNPLLPHDPGYAAAQYEEAIEPA